MLNIHNIYFIRFYHNFNLMYSEKRTMLKINTKKIVIDLIKSKIYNYSFN